MGNEFESRICPKCGEAAYFDGTCWECQECDHRFDCVDDDEEQEEDEDED